MPTVTIRETYDLSTKPDKMTLIGIHTPSRNILKKLYPGFCEQYKMVKILHQNVRIACASRLPVDPSGIGVNTEGQIAPEDMFNPILYKAVSNQSLSNLELRIRGLYFRSLTVNGESADTSNENVTGYASEHQVYYSLLSNLRGWKTAHPQAGLSMRRLRPLVYERWYNEGYNQSSARTSAETFGVDSSTSSTNRIETWTVDSMRGRAHRMPAFNTKYLTGVQDSSAEGVGSSVENGMSPGYPVNAFSEMPILPMIYTGLILVPPSRNTRMYYRMVVETVVSFFGVQTMDEITTFSALNSRDNFPVYWNDYRESNKNTALKVDENTVSASEGAEITKIMES